MEPTPDGTAAAKASISRSRRAATSARHEVGGEEPDAAVDVVADTAGAHDAVRPAGGHDAPDREAVALVDVRHRQGCHDDPGEGRGIGDLLSAASWRIAAMRVSSA